MTALDQGQHSGHTAWSPIMATTPANWWGQLAEAMIPSTS